MHLRKSSFQLILYAFVFQLKDHMVLYSGYTDPDYKTMVFYSAPLLSLREGHFSNRSPGLMLRKNRYTSVSLLFGSWCRWPVNTCNEITTGPASWHWFSTTHKSVFMPCLSRAIKLQNKPSQLREGRRDIQPRVYRCNYMSRETELCDFFHGYHGLRNVQDYWSNRHRINSFIWIY